MTEMVLGSQGGHLYCSSYCLFPGLLSSTCDRPPFFVFSHFCVLCPGGGGTGERGVWGKGRIMGGEGEDKGRGGCISFRLEVVSAGGVDCQDTSFVPTVRL